MLRLDCIEKSYGSGSQKIAVLRSISLFLPSGDSCAILGPSGSGKSSLLNIVGLLDRPDSGSMTLADRPVDFSSPYAAAWNRNTLLGFVFQSFHLLPRLTALENVALPLLYRRVPRPDRQSRAMAMLDRVGLEGRALHRPAELSGGQRQRVAIARALVGGPKLILADEPTGSLDSKTASDVIDLLAGLNRDMGVSILMVTHDPAMADRCSRQIELLDGKIVRDTAAA